MAYLSVAEIAKRWGVSERTVRNYCAAGKIPGAFLTGKTWNVPDNAQRPKRANQKADVPQTLLDRYGLVERVCRENQKQYKDVLIYRKDYRLTELDRAFITELCRSKRQYL